MTQAIYEQFEHRPFPLPEGPWMMYQSWRELLFAHWSVPVSVLRPLIPPVLDLDVFEGRAWIGLTPFRMVDLRPRFFPAAPGVSEFPELNCRTYVTLGGKPGIYFFSLDAGSRLAVLGARLGFRLPYFFADMGIRITDGWIDYHSRRRDDSGADFVGRYRPIGPAMRAEAGTLEYFLAERYALYTVLRNGGVLRGDIHHGPWLLQRAEAEIDRNTVPESRGIQLPPVPPLLHYAARQDTLVWPPRRVS
jgi:hypothetical protein